jgi:uncharacterized membrane protein YqjE
MSAGDGAAGYRRSTRMSDEEAGRPDEGIGSLLGGIIKDLQDMVRGEIQLARAEIRDDMGTIRSSLMSIGLAALFALTGFIFAMLAATYVLNIWVRMWIAAAIVGAALLTIGMVLAMSAKKKMSAASLKPEQTIASVKETSQWAKQQIS